MNVTILNIKTVQVESNVANVNSLVKKTNHNAKISDIKAKCFITYDYIKFKSEHIWNKS